MGDPALVTLHTYMHRDEADLARLRLAAAGIPAMVAADDEGGLSPGFFTEHRVRLVTTADRLDDALRELHPEAESLQIGSEARAAMVHHAAVMAPFEACGLLAIGHEGDDATVRMVYCLTNIDRSPVRFTVAPAEHYGALRHAERNGWELGGVFHSHPKALPFPSATDVTGALDPSWFHVIVGPQRAPSIRAFRIRDGRVADVVIAPWGNGVPR